MTDYAATSSPLILVQSEDSRTRIQCRFDGKLSAREVERTAVEVA